jgi:hypothetical protein
MPEDQVRVRQALDNTMSAVMSRTSSIDSISMINRAVGDESMLGALPRSGTARA